jgi:acyl carrier protein
MDQVKEKLRAFIARYLGGHTLGDDDQIFAAGFANSMFAMQLVAFVEKEFGIAIANEDLELENFSSIAAMAALVERKNVASPRAAN